jgi:hypothetical protein
MFREAKFGRDDITRTQDEEIIILRDDKGEHRKGKKVGYEDTDETHLMQEELREYNDLIASSFIDIRTLDAPVITITWDVYGGEAAACSGYMARMKAFDTKTGKSISPI